jgi:hypothetical protein
VRIFTSRHGLATSGDATNIKAMPSLGKLIAGLDLLVFTHKINKSIAIAHV